MYITVRTVFSLKALPIKSSFKAKNRTTPKESQVMDLSRKVFFKALLVLILFTLSNTNLTKSSNWTTCESRDTRCQFSHVSELRTIMNFPLDLLRLDLSGNNLQEIPQRSLTDYPQLIYLSLSSNKIHTILKGAFTGLTRLRELNLQDNMIHHWDTTLIHQDLPNLIMLNIAQNMYWKPDQQILSLPNLKVIRLLVAFIPWPVEQPKICSYMQCHLVRRHLEMSSINYSFIQDIPKSFQQVVEPDLVTKSPDRCRYNKLHFVNGKYWDVIDGNGFYFHCGKVCLLTIHSKINKFDNPNQQKVWFYFLQSVRSYCWNLINSIQIAALTEGICAMVFNLIVILTTLRSRVLRESVAHVLVANIAVGDLLFSVYLITITATRKSMSSIDEFGHLYNLNFCRIVGFFGLVGQFSSPVMSFIMTLERYLAVVYCMRPHIRITRTTCYVAMVTIWGLSVSLAVSFMTSPKFSVQTDDICVPFKNIDNINILVYMGGIGLGLYILSIALYVHMYRDFQKTNQSKTVQLQRENRLARRIALIMFTNVLFFIFPLLIVGAVNIFQRFVSYMSLYIFWKTFGIICLGINPCINPILFSFRSEKFRTELRRCYSLCRSSVSPR